MDTQPDEKPVPTLKELYPGLTPEELIEAEENLKHYLLLILRIYERIEKDPVRMAQLEQEIRRSKRSG